MSRGHFVCILGAVWLAPIAPTWLSAIAGGMFTVLGAYSLLKD